jgi:hypothetical protein
MKKYSINVYPTTDLVHDRISHTKYVESLIRFLINEMYYGRRFDSENLEKLFAETIKCVKEIESGKLPDFVK